MALLCEYYLEEPYSANILAATLAFWASMLDFCIFCLKFDFDFIDPSSSKNL